MTKHKPKNRSRTWPFPRTSPETSPGGTETVPTQPVLKLHSFEELSVPAPNVIGTDTTPTAPPSTTTPTPSPSAAPSEAAAKEAVSFRLDDLPGYTISRTSCCGLYEVHGSHNAFTIVGKHDRPEFFFLGIEKAFQKHVVWWNQQTALLDVARNLIDYDKQDYEKYYAHLGRNDFSRRDQYRYGTQMPGCLMFTMVRMLRGYPESLGIIKYAEENDLGKFSISESFHNPNSSNDVNVMLWFVNQAGWYKFVQKHFPTREG